MALKRKHDTFARIESIITDRLFAQMLPITSPEDFGEALDEAARQQWADRVSQIPKVTGDLREILTAAHSTHRVIKARSGRVVMEIKHNGVVYRPSVRDAVRQALDMRLMIRTAVDSLRKKQSTSSRRGRRR